MSHSSVSAVIAVIAVMTSLAQLQVYSPCLHPVYSAIPRSMGVICPHNLEEGGLQGRFSIWDIGIRIADFCFGVMEPQAG